LDTYEPVFCFGAVTSSIQIKSSETVDSIPTSKTMPTAMSNTQIVNADNPDHILKGQAN
jgi:hypothetical protein